jgi:hypothetical protein
MPRKVRDYKKERKYDSQPHVKKKRAARNRARSLLEKEGIVKKGDGKDVDHKDGNPNNNKRSNLRVQPASKNRSYPRNKKAGKKRSLLKKD